MAICDKTHLYYQSWEILFLDASEIASSVEEELSFTQALVLSEETYQDIVKNVVPSSKG